MSGYRRWIDRVRQTWPYVQELFSNEIYVYVSAIAMNALFSFTPFVILIATISNALFPDSALSDMIYDVLALYLPFSDAPAPPLGNSDLDFVLRNLRKISESFGTIQLVSMILLIWSVASVFIPLEMTMNRALGVRESRGFWRSQWLAIRMVLAMAVMSFAFIGAAAVTKNLIHTAVNMIAFVAVAGAAATGNVAGYIFPAFLNAAESILAFINIKLWMIPLTMLSFCMVFYYAPNTRVPFKEMWPAAIFTGIVWELSNYVFVFAVPFMGLYELFGPFTIAITWMTWAYLGGLILVLGANLMARKALTEHVDRVKEALWNSKTESPL